MRFPRTSGVTSTSRVCSRSEKWSRTWRPLVTSTIRAASATVRVSGPTRDQSSRPQAPATGMRPDGGRYPTTPQQEAGTRIEPPMSEPVAHGVMPDATAAADPPLEPPTSKAGFHGLRVTPHIRLCVQNGMENSGVSPRPWTTDPASTSRSTMGSDSSDT